MRDNFKNIASKSDADLLLLLKKSGNNEYLGYLYKRYTALIYGICLKYLKKQEDAEDAVMQIFEILLNKINNYEIKEFRTWIHSVARNHCLQKLRKKNLELNVDFEKDFVDFEKITHLLSEGYDDKLMTELNDCIKKLPPKQRECIESFFFENKSYADISEEKKHDVKSIKSYIQNGKRNLKICMGKNKNEFD